jgi:hypothetical protein
MEVILQVIAGVDLPELVSPLVHLPNTLEATRVLELLLQLAEVLVPWTCPLATSPSVLRWNGWYAPIAISESLAPSMDLWLMLADPIMMYSSSTITKNRQITCHYTY